MRFNFRSLVFFALLVCVLPTGSSQAATSQSAIPAIVTDGFAVYQKSGGKAAMGVWLKGSPLANDTATQMTVNGGLAQTETIYGKMIGYDPIRVVSLTPSLRLVYVMAKFERGPMFFEFDCYRAGNEWTIPELSFNAKANNILPQSVLAGER